MDRETVNNIINKQDSDSHWASVPIIKHGDKVINLADAVGNKAKTPVGAPNQPELFPGESFYQFDRTKFCGEASYDELKDMITNACEGCTMQKRVCGVKGRYKTTYQLRCDHYRCANAKEVQNNFNDGQFTKDGLKKATVKQQSSTTAFSRMDDRKIRSKKKPKQKNSDMKRKKVVDHRGNQPVKESADKSNNTKANQRRGGLANLAESPETRCQMNVTIFMNNESGNFERQHFL